MYTNVVLASIHSWTWMFYVCLITVNFIIGHENVVILVRFYSTMIWFFYQFMQHICRSHHYFKDTIWKVPQISNIIHKGWSGHKITLQQPQKIIRVQLVEQELSKISEHLSSPPVFSGVCVARSLVVCVMFVDCCLPLFFWPLCCLSFFDLRILIFPLVSSNSS